MKWRRKKSSTGHAPQPQIFPISWLSKLKQMSSSTKTKPPPVNAKPKVKPESPRSSNIPVCFRPPRRSDVGSNSPGRERIRKNQTEFMLPGEDMCRSSRMQSSESEGSGGFSEDKSAVQFLSCESFGSNGKSAAKEIYEFSEAGKFGDMLSEVKKMKFKTRLEKERSKSVDYRFETPKWIAEHEYLRTADKRIPEDDMIFCRRSFHEDHVSMKREQKVLDPFSGKAISIDRRRSDSSTDMGHHKSLSLSLNLRRLNQRIMKDDSTILSNSEKKSVKDDQEIESVASKSNKRGGGEPNSCQGNRDSNKRKIRRRPRARVQSPRTAMRMETCKIRAVDELKKAKKKREKQRGRAFESFAVVKCSFNPHQDFRESMVEMIAENGIRHPEELESLLACYLSLNSEEYHSLIVKVFRQVWFDLNIDSSVTQFEERHYH